MTTVTIDLPLPHKSLSPNVKVHWSVYSRHAKKARYISGYATLAAMRELGMDAPMWDRAEVQCRFYFATNRTRDMDNCISSCKSVFDGIADSGLIKNDSGFTHKPPEMLIDKVNPRLVIEITKL